MAGYIGNTPFTKASYDQKEYIATEGQTTFNVVYSAHFVDVLLNGVQLSEDDYTASDGMSIVLDTPCVADDIVTIKTWGTFVPADSYKSAEVDSLLDEKADLSGGNTFSDTQVFNGPVTMDNGISYVGGATLVDNASATFTNSTNNINATGIGVGIEVGDVIQVSGSTDNDTEFTVEVITDANNVIVNQAHAGGSTSKSLVDETATVTVKLLCKWYLAPIGLGQGWVDVTASRSDGTTYSNNLNRLQKVLINSKSSASDRFRFVATFDGQPGVQAVSATPTTGLSVLEHNEYSFNSTFSIEYTQGSIDRWLELR